MSKRKCPYLDYEWCWGEDGEEFEEKICPIESHYKGELRNCYCSTDYKDCVTYNLQQEKVRLNNIINELEKDIRNNMAYYDKLYEEQDEQEYIDKYFAFKIELDKLQELKGDK